MTQINIKIKIKYLLIKCMFYLLHPNTVTNASVHAILTKSNTNIP